MKQKRDAQPVYLLRLGQRAERWRVALKTPEGTLYFVTLEAFMLFLAQESEGMWAERAEMGGVKSGVESQE